MSNIITVAPLEIERRLRLKPGRNHGHVHDVMQRWFFRWAKRNNCAMTRVRIEIDDDLSLREHAIVATVEVVSLSGLIGMEPGQLVEVADGP